MTKTGCGKIFTVPSQYTLQGITDRYLAVSCISRETGRWGRQKEHGKAFFHTKCRMSDRFIQGMLAGKYWLGSYVRKDELTDRIAFDIDCKTPEDLEDRTERYWAIRGFMGTHRVPLVWATPSGSGLRVVYRIPLTPLKEILTRQNHGVLPDLLRYSGIDVRNGRVEIFPQFKKLDRLPLGLRMPFLDPETLEPLLGSGATEERDEESLLRDLEILEIWHAKPDSTLVPKLRKRHRIFLSEAGPTDRGVLRMGERIEVSGDGAVHLPKSWLRSFEEGLTRSNSRHDAEWKVGLVLLHDERARKEFGLDPEPTDEDLAGAISKWVGLQNNHLSEEWNRNPNPEYWRSRYLAKTHADGRNLIQCLRDAGERAGIGNLPTKREFRRILRLAEATYPPGKSRYRFECWAVAFVRGVKSVIRNGYATERGGTPVRGRPVSTHVEVQLHSQWMKAWPFGGRRYKEFLAVCEKAEWCRMTKEYFVPDSKRGEEPRARTYLVPVPDLSRRGEGLPVLYSDLNQGVKKIRGLQRALSLEEGFHALRLADGVSDLRERYGAATARNIERIRKRLLALNLKNPTEPSGN